MEKGPVRTKGGTEESKLLIRPRARETEEAKRSTVSVGALHERVILVRCRDNGQLHSENVNLVQRLNVRS